jgi:hypothetical protein
MLIDEFLPKYDFVETHDIKIRAAAENVYQALWEMDVCESWIARWLFFLRGLPSDKMTLKDLKRVKFEILDKIINRELVIGLAGKFWSINGSLQKVTAENFRQFDKKGFAKAAWNFSIEETGNGSRLMTETRIQCLDDESRRSFGFYWTFIQPFSGLIRMEMLKIVKRKAEATSS